MTLTMQEKGNMIILMNVAGNIARKSPTGWRDPEALNKMRDELIERDKATNALDRLIETADCAYYCVKAFNNHLSTGQEFHAELANILQGYETTLVTEVLSVKYRDRNANGKDTDRERVVVQAALRRLGYDYQ